MAICRNCGNEFDLSDARRTFGRWYGAGSYNEFFEDGDMCIECGVDEVGADMATGSEIQDMLDDWD